MKSTRERVLQTLLTNPNSTINALAEAVGINAVSVRHHLTSLQADNLVQSQEERHGVGRPRLVYSLTEKGAELFPTRYLKLINQLLVQLKNSMPKEELERLLVQIAVDLSAEFAKKIKHFPMEKKLDAIRVFLAQEGYVIEWEKQNAQYVITEITCPFYHISQKHPEVCMIDHAIFSSLLSLPVERVKCILTGDNHCSYLIQQN
ncbi:MAG: winged helix-turn-helix transcriptional regulator [Chloroflexi bacterium]|nr:winged helix-turn-helix transcriptional regulator [Chloroflexota bacterium]